MSISNQGKQLQETIAACAAYYAHRGIAKIHKVDPPCRIVGAGFKRKTIYLENPFVDFIGTWAARGGRTIALEAKSTEKPTLPVSQDGGVTAKQLAALQDWRDHGAAVGVLWEYGEDIRFVPLDAIRSQLDAGIKHVKWEHARPVPEGLGFCRFDFLAVLAIYFPV